MYGVDDLRGVDALQVCAGHAEVGMPELALDDGERDSFSGELDGVGVAELVRRGPSPDTRRGGQAAEFGAGAGV
jgi:hypothetical protein